MIEEHRSNRSPVGSWLWDGGEQLWPLVRERLLWLWLFPFVNERKSENLIYVKFVVHFYELKGAAIPSSG